MRTVSELSLHFVAEPWWSEDSRVSYQTLSKVLNPRMLQEGFKEPQIVKVLNFSAGVETFF
jgi:hypothetical protein